MDAILKHDRALKNGQSGSGCGSFIRAEYMQVSSSSLGIPGGKSVSKEMQKANAFSFSLSLFLTTYSTSDDGSWVDEGED